MTITLWFISGCDQLLELYKPTCFVHAVWSELTLKIVVGKSTLKNPPNKASVILSDSTLGKATAQGSIFDISSWGTLATYRVGTVF